jgi:hypothetical protein
MKDEGPIVRMGSVADFAACDQGFLSKAAFKDAHLP